MCERCVALAVASVFLLLILPDVWRGCGQRLGSDALLCQEAPAEQPCARTNNRSCSCELLSAGRQYGPFSWWSRTWSHTAYIWDTGGPKKRRKTGCYTMKPQRFFSSTGFGTRIIEIKFDDFDRKLHSTRLGLFLTLQSRWDSLLAP